MDTYKEVWILTSFLTLNFLKHIFKDSDENYYNNSLKHACSYQNIFFITVALVSTTREAFLKDVFNGFEDIGK